MLHILGCQDACKKVKAENKKQFEEIWNEHISQVAYLSHSLPNTEALEVLSLVNVLKEYTELASRYTYGGGKEA